MNTKINAHILGNGRRDFIQTGLKTIMVTGIAGSAFLAGCKMEEEDEEQKISPPEDLMQQFDNEIN